MNLTETPIRQTVIYEGKIITVRVDDARLPNGKTAKREVVEHPGGVCIAALTDTDELLFVRQFRYPYAEVIPELPAGKLNRGEDPLPAGMRELKEETGATAAHYESLGQLYPSPGYCGEIIHLYLATGLSFGVFGGGAYSAAAGGKYGAVRRDQRRQNPDGGAESLCRPPKAGVTPWHPAKTI